MYKTLVKKFPWLIVLAIILIVCAAMPEMSWAGELGDEAVKRSAETMNEKAPISQEKAYSLSTWIPRLLILLLVLAGALVALASRLIDFNPFRHVNASSANGKVWLVYGVAFTVYVIYEFLHNGSKILPGAVSEHGAKLDILFWITVTITTSAFAITHVFLFYYAYKYRARPGNVALYYPDNHALEKGLAGLTALGLVFLLAPGLYYWHIVFHPQEDPQKVVVEVLAEQFQWRIRYAGQDRKLGKHEFKRLSDINPVGIDSSDKSAADDIILPDKIMHLPKGRRVDFMIRSKDVLHGVYAPYHRVNLYAIPGSPTTFTFKPTKTTAEIRRELGKPDFNYEMLCSQICGASHYNMRVVIVVEEEKEFNLWLSEQKTLADGKEKSPTAPEAKNLSSN